jgi:osmotically-inducible protein OsmY
MVLKKMVTLLMMGTLLFSGSVVCADTRDEQKYESGLSTSPGDQNIAQNFRAKTAGNPAAANITITVKDGVVFLKGLVDTPLQRQEIINAAESVPNVQRVDSAIVVRGENHQQSS